MQEKRPKKDPKRSQRLAEALRANLKRRKEKDRALRKTSSPAKVGKDD